MSHNDLLKPDSQFGCINQQLASLYTQFGQNVLADETDYVLYLEEKDLAGLPESLVLEQVEMLGTEVVPVLRAEFERRREAGEFLEWAEYSGHLYGTPRSSIGPHLAAGRHVVLDIEVKGARQLRQKVPGAVHVFILPPSGQVLVERLRGRNTETTPEPNRMST